MLNLLYNIALLLLGIAAFPKIVWQWAILGKYREGFSSRLGFNLPSMPADKQVIWIHAVSMGETRAVIPFFRIVHKKFPDALIVISSTTETGHAEAKRSMPEAAAHFFLPLDFSWAIRKAMKQIHPNILILCESDFWYQLISQAKSQGASVFLISGKVSERSAKRFERFSCLSKRLFSCFDRFCLQSKRHQERFVAMGIDAAKLSVTGNLKFDVTPPALTPADLQDWKKELGIQESDRVVVIGSSHAPEEEWLLAALDRVWQKIPDLKVLLVPRHPERFTEVADHVKKRGYTVSTYSERQHQTGKERIVLIDAMGLLNRCYQAADLAIVAGSFIPTIGGHNIFEPVLLGIPVLFGPHMHAQSDLKELVLGAHAGQQVSLEELPDTVITLLTNPNVYNTLQQACRTMRQEVQGSAQRTYDALFPRF